MKTQIRFCKFGPIRKTMWPELGYQNQGGVWRFIDTTDNGPVGPQYPSQTVLLADMRRYAKEFGNLEY